MKISSDDIAPIIGALAGFLTVVGGLVTNIVMMVHQNRKIEEHNTTLRSDIKDLKDSSTGTHKVVGSVP